MFLLKIKVRLFGKVIWNYHSKSGTIAFTPSALETVDQLSQNLVRHFLNEAWKI